jgi:predicted Zn finger-like uncharacterized protein
VIIQCSSCQARYHYDESRFGSATAKRIKCTKCTTVFEIRNPAVALAPDVSAPRSAAGPSPDEFSLDETALTEARKRRSSPAAIPGAPARVVPMAAAAPGTASVAPASGETTGPIGARAGPTDRMPVAGATRQTARPLRLPADQRLSLACISGPDSGRIFEIDKPRVVIGRANADIVVADIQCSRQHAAIEVMDEHVFVADLNSTNGTYVNDQRVGRAELDNRTEFEIGTTTLMLIRSFEGEGPTGG